MWRRSYRDNRFTRWQTGRHKWRAAVPRIAGHRRIPQGEPVSQVPSRRESPSARGCGRDRGRTGSEARKVVHATVDGHGIEILVAAQSTERDAAGHDGGRARGHLLQKRRAVAVEKFADDAAARAPVDFQAIPMVGRIRLVDRGQIRVAVSRVLLKGKLPRVGCRYQRKRSRGTGAETKIGPAIRRAAELQPNGQCVAGFDLSCGIVAIYPIAAVVHIETVDAVMGCPGCAVGGEITAHNVPGIRRFKTFNQGSAATAATTSTTAAAGRTNGKTGRRCAVQAAG